MNKQDLREQIVNRVISQMEKGIESWRKTWFNPDQKLFRFPFNPISTTKYSGHNFILLGTATRMVRNGDELIDTGVKFNDPRWCTFLQAKSKDYSIKKGEVATSVYFYDFRLGIHNTVTNTQKAVYIKNEPEFFENSLKLFNSHKSELAPIALEFSKKFNENLPYGEKKALFTEFVANIAKVTKEPVEFKPICVLSEHKLFNFEQMENVPELVSMQADFTPNERAENILKNSGAKIIHDRFGIQNYYIHNLHEIHLVPKEYHDSETAYYATAMHELAHWTAGEGIQRSYGEYNSIDHSLYAKEELVAELASLFICAEIDLPYDISNHASYLASWVNALKNDKNELFRAMHDASLVSDYIHAFDHSLAKVQTIETTNENGNIYVAYTSTIIKKMVIVEDLGKLANQLEAIDIPILANPSEREFKDHSNTEFNQGNFSGIELVKFKTKEELKDFFKDHINIYTINVDQSVLPTNQSLEIER